MKILYLITKSEIGGASVHVRDLAFGMQARGHEVALMCPSGGWLDVGFLKTNKNFYPNDFLANTINPVGLFGATVGISEAIVDWQPDIISCHSSMAGVLGRIVAIFYAKPKVTFTAHSWAFTAGAPLWRKVLMIPAEKFLALFTDLIICVSNFDKKLALKYRISNNEKIKVIHNGVKDRPMRNLEKKSVFRIISVMRLDYPKLPKLLISAFALFSKTNPNSELLIIGSGSKKSEINSVIKELGETEKVKILDKVVGEEVMSHLASSDLFALLSRHEGLPLTILEAMSVGLPILASNVGGISEEIDSSCGVLVENDVNKIQEAILKITSNQELAISMSQNSWKKQRENFSTERFINETEEIYKELLTFSNSQG